jgi:segregation and condensation protein B
MHGEQNSDPLNGHAADPSGDASIEQALPLKSLVESLLFVADEPIRLDRVATVLQVSADQVMEALDDLAQEYEQQRGLRLQIKGRRVQMVTAPETTEVVRQFLGLELDSKLSPAAMETLAIVAYNQPATRAQIEAVRGVNSDTVLRTLINRGLIEETGRLEQAGRPIIYGTTFEFLQHFGLSSLDQLPPLEELELP